jgi:O-antigen/teichoic acid export membrane protein
VALARRRAPGGQATVSIRRALFWSTAERYVGLLLNFVLIVVLSRLLTPAEVGIMQLGWMVMVLTETLRDFGIGSYLVQRPALSPVEVRTAFTFSLVLAIVPTWALVAGAGAIAAFYDEPGVRAFLRVYGPTLLLAPFSAIPLALLRRDLEFGKLAFINLACALLNVVTTTGLVLLGLRYMSSAWAAWVWGVGFIVLTQWVRPDLSAFRLSVAGWRSVLPFGAYSVVPEVLQRLWEFLPTLVVGRVVSVGALGIFDRAAKIAELPQKLGTIGVRAVALPGFATQARAGGSLSAAYLDAVEHVTAVQWPGLLLLVLLAEPVVGLLLGPQWTAAVALTRVIAVAYLASFSQFLSSAVLVAAGHVRDTMVLALITLPALALAFVLAARQGLFAAAVSLIAIELFRAVVANALVCRRLGIGAQALAARLGRSLAVTAAAMVGPLAILAARGFDPPLGLAAAAGLAATALPGWLAGLWLTRHPLAGELRDLLRRS